MKDTEKQKTERDSTYSPTYTSALLGKYRLLYLQLYTILQFIDYICIYVNIESLL